MGAENRHHPPRPRPRETLLPCRHAASPRPSMGGGPLRGRVQPKAKVGRAERGGGDPLLWPLAPQKQSLTSGEGWAEGRGSGRRRSLSQGTLMPPSLGTGRGRGAQSGWRWGVSATPREGRPRVVPRGPRGRASPSPRSWPPGPRSSSGQARAETGGGSRRNV